jgi:hypothetical protein
VPASKVWQGSVYSCQSCLRWPQVACACLCTYGCSCSGEYALGYLLGPQICLGQLLFLVIDLLAAIGRTVQYVMQTRVMQTRVMQSRVMQSKVVWVALPIAQHSSMYVRACVHVASCRINNHVRHLSGGVSRHASNCLRLLVLDSPGAGSAVHQAALLYTSFSLVPAPVGEMQEWGRLAGFFCVACCTGVLHQVP